MDSSSAGQPSGSGHVLDLVAIDPVDVGQRFLAAHRAGHVGRHTVELGGPDQVRRGVANLGDAGATGAHTREQRPALQRVVDESPLGPHPSRVRGAEIETKGSTGLATQLPIRPRSAGRRRLLVCALLRVAFLAFGGPVPHPGDESERTDHHQDVTPPRPTTPAPLVAVAPPTAAAGRVVVLPGLIIPPRSVAPLGRRRRSPWLTRRAGPAAPALTCPTAASPPAVPQGPWSGARLPAR